MNRLMGNNTEVLSRESIIKIRERRGWTQERLAEEIGTTKQTVNRWEKGHNECKGKFAEKLRDLELEWSRSRHRINGKVRITFEVEGLTGETTEGEQPGKEESIKNVQIRGINFVAIGGIVINNENDEK